MDFNSIGLTLSTAEPISIKCFPVSGIFVENSFQVLQFLMDNFEELIKTDFVLVLDQLISFGFLFTLCVTSQTAFSSYACPLVNTTTHLHPFLTLFLLYYFCKTGDEMMIEADVTLAESSRYPIPIMAHPPLNMSDLTLEDFLVQVIQCDRGKGVKLDFKSTRVVEPAFRVLARHADQLRTPLVLNADILPGEHPSNAQPVDAWTFLMLCRTRFPKSIISIGWCADVSASCSGPMASRGYTRQMVDQMLAIVKEYSLMQPVTFPVNAALAKYSVSELQRLLFQLPNSTLTLWAHEGDPVTIEDLLVLRKAFAHNQLFYDLPEDFLNVLRLQAYKQR